MKERDEKDDAKARAWSRLAKARAEAGLNRDDSDTLLARIDALVTGHDLQRSDESGVQRQYFDRAAVEVVGEHWYRFNGRLISRAQGAENGRRMIEAWNQDDRAARTREVWARKRRAAP